MTPSLPPDLAAAVKLGGEMGQRFAEFDWEAHPLGPPQDWPVEVRSAVSVALTSGFPIVLWLGAQDLFLVYNDAYIPLLGDKHPEALGRRGRYVWWDIWEPIEPMLTSVITTGEATWSDDLMLPIMTGGRRQERFFTFTYGPMIGGGGEVCGIFCAVAETTERVLSKRRLYLLNSVASAVMDSRTIDDAVAGALAVCTDQPADLPFVAAYVGERGSSELTLRGATASVQSLLPPTLAGLTDWDPQQRSRLDIQIIDNVASVLVGIDDILGSGCPDQALVLPMGDEGPVAGALVVGTSPRRPLDAQYRGFCQLLADQLSSAMASAVSYEQERRRADALAELDRAKTAFFTNVSHEFRTPLTLLTGPLEDALAEAGDDQLLTHRLRTARRNAARLLRLVDSLLDFSRLEAGRAAADLVCTDVGSLTAHIASSFTELCQRAGIDLVLDCHPTLADVDPAMWETIILNLLSNAVKYTLAGSIFVTAHKDSAHCHIAIRDTGVGISQDDLKQVGKRFFRAHSARGRTVEGAGIGLALVRGLVELQHGTFQIDSELDRGTTVTIRLPTSASDAPVDWPGVGLGDNPYVVEANQWLASPQSSAGSEAGNDGRELVLIADDNADMRAHLEWVLAPFWRTVLAGDGDAALQMARELRPDLIVTDVMMPGLDGLHFLAAIRADAELAATPVVMLSARADAEAVSEGYAAGADDYLPKPFRSQDLVERVGARLSAAARERASRQITEAQTRLALDFTHLEAALQATSSISEIVETLKDSPIVSGDATVISLGLLDADGESVRFEFAGPVPTEMRDRYYVASMDTPLVPIDVIKTGEPMVITDTLSLGERYRHVVQETATGVRACVSQPLRGLDGRVIGSLGLLWPTPREFDAAELDMFARTALITQSAVDRIRSVQREHRIAVEFQEHLLDLDRRSTAAVVAAVYQPAGEAMRVGGDWYLVVPLERPGEVAISVGDVVGHGLPAAIVMSRLRAAVAATANSDGDPTAVLTALDRYAATVEGARCATVSYAVIEAGVGDAPARIRYSCAGHPYPLLVAPGAAPVFLRSGRRPPIAAWPDSAPHTAGAEDLPPGSLILLYTDGLIERLGETLDQGFTRLEGAAAYRADLPVGEVCAELLERMAPPGGYTDDVVLLAIRPCHSSARSFATVLPATLSHIGEARHRLRDWLGSIGADSRRLADVLLATGEAVTNGIEHGSRGNPAATVSVEAFLRGDAVEVTVSDAGQWSSDSSASQRSQRRGRGLTLMNGLADHVSTARTAQGTRVTLRFDQVVASDERLVHR